MASSQTINNDSVQEGTLKILMAENYDVYFTFNSDDDADGSQWQDLARIPAHKKVLAAWSPVFSAEFGNSQKEEDIVITGASPTAFKTFLQFFYGRDIDLSLDCIEEVMNLVVKYNVVTAWPILIEFLKRSLTVDDILWGLSLAVKFRLEDLKVFCTKIIESNCARVSNMIEIDESGKPKLRSNPNGRPLSEAALASILRQIFETINAYLANPSKDCEIENDILPLTLNIGEGSQMWKSYSTERMSDFTIDSNRRLVLVSVEFSKMFSEMSCQPIKLNINWWLEENLESNQKSSNILFQHSYSYQFELGQPNIFALPRVIVIKPESKYRFYTQIVPCHDRIKIQQRAIIDGRVKLDPHTSIGITVPQGQPVLFRALNFRYENANA